MTRTPRHSDDRHPTSHPHIHLCASPSRPPLAPRPPSCPIAHPVLRFGVVSFRLFFCVCACMLRALRLVFFFFAAINASKAGLLCRAQVGWGGVGWGNRTKLGGHISSHGPQAPVMHTQGSTRKGAHARGAEWREGEKEEGLKIGEPGGRGKRPQGRGPGVNPGPLFLSLEAPGTCMLVA
jgi:hypothetical protein